MESIFETTTGRRIVLKVAVLALSGAVLLAGLSGLSGCQANEPFDPDSLANIPPVIKFFVAPVDPDGDLRSTSYFRRTFRWSGTDQDGWVREYYVSIRSQQNVPAPWDTTARTDTTMTFTINEEGQAEATFLIACRDDRGALSDTLVQYVPMQNFTPVVNFESDFDPLLNMQREIDNSGAEPDTTYWNWGPCNFRFFALDEDGVETMDGFFRYTLAPGDPQQTWDEGDPGADPQIGWIRRYLPAGEEVKEFTLEFGSLNPGPITLTVSLKDEAGADAWFQYSWEVRPPAGPVLFVEDNCSSATSALFHTFLNERFGDDGWDLYARTRKYPDSEHTLLESFKLFDLVLWAGGSMTSNLLYTAADRDGVLEKYVLRSGGKLWMVSRALVGISSTLPISFIQGVLDIYPVGAPESSLSIPAGKVAFGLSPHLPDLVSRQVSLQNGGGMGLSLEYHEETAEALYQLEECAGCYNRREPYDPVVVVRTPAGSGVIPAQVVSIGVDLEYFEPEQMYPALAAILELELGVVAR